jgi:serine protease
LPNTKLRALPALVLVAVVFNAAVAPAWAAPAEDAPVERLIVKFRDGAARTTLALTDRIARVAADEGVALTHRRSMALGAHVLALGRPLARRAAEALVARLSQRADVEFAQVDRRRRPLLVPNDTFFAQQTYLQNSPGGISAIGAWDTTTGSPSTVVAVVDSGYRPHADLAGRILPGYDFITDAKIANDGDGRDADASDPGDWISTADLSDPDFTDCDRSPSTWHGTSVAGIVAADTNNGQYLAGVDWAAKILPVRVLGKCGGYDSDILDGIAWAAGLPVPGVPANPYPAHVINLSFGGPDPCPAGYASVFSQALAHGVTRAIIAAAGNDNADVAQEAPANCPQVIAVAATARTGSLAPYSNYGAGVALSAPGGTGGTDAIYVLSNSGGTVPGSDTYGAEAGTSFAAPIVAGVASLVLGVAPNLTTAQLRSVLTSSAKPFPAGTCSASICGAGIVAADAAVQAAIALAGGGIANVQGLWWASGGVESGWGVNFAHQGNQIFATWYTYDTTGKGWWLSMLATRTSGNTYSGPIYVDSGPAFNAYVGAGVAAQVGNGTLVFADANNGSFSYTVNGTTQAKSIARYDLATGPQPTCTYSAITPNFAAATNYQDLWWVANGAESGWGINFAHQGTSVFATWYTYDVDRSPLWLSVLATRVGASNVYAGPLYRTSGPRFDAYDAAQVLPAQVGTASLTFADGNHATFAYTTSGLGGLPATSQAKAITRFPFAATGGTLCQ